jgi:hypothetical protein
MQFFADYAQLFKTLCLVRGFALYIPVALVLPLTFNCQLTTIPISNFCVPFRLCGSQNKVFVAVGIVD